MTNIFVLGTFDIYDRVTYATSLIKLFEISPTNGNLCPSLT